MKRVNKSLKITIHTLFFFFNFNIKCSYNKIDLSTENKLTSESKKFKYSSTVTIGLSANVTRGCFTSANENSFGDYWSSEQNDKYSFIFSGIGFNVSYDFLFSSYKCAKKLGVFPRFGINFNIISQNYLTRFFAYLPQNINTFFKNATIRIGNFFGEHAYKLFCMRYPRRIETPIGQYRKNFLAKPSGIFNLTFTFEPEIGLFEKFKVVPQIGFGPSLVFLTKNCIAPFFPSDRSIRANNDKYYNNSLIDIVFSSKIIFKFAVSKNFLNMINIELGYTYNPLFFSQAESLWNVFLNLSYSRNINIGLETVDFFNKPIETSIAVHDDRINYNKKNKNTMFLECGLGVSKWVNISSSKNYQGDSDINKYNSYSPNINLSFSLPYFGVKLSNNHYLSFIGIDITEELFTNKYDNLDHNIIWGMINNLSVNYNFLNFVSDFNGVIFMHKLGVYVPFLTNIMTSMGNMSKSHFFQRETISVGYKEQYRNSDNSIKYLFFGRFTYRFKLYLDILRMFNCRTKYPSYFYIGINTTLINRKSDFYTSKQSLGKFDTEIIKFDSINIGISFVLN